MNFAGNCWAFTNSGNTCVKLLYCFPINSTKSVLPNRWGHFMNVVKLLIPNSIIMSFVAFSVLFSFTACKSSVGTKNDSNVKFTDNGMPVEKAPAAIKKSAVMLYRIISSEEWQPCSGVLVSDHRILTADHCFDSTSKEQEKEWNIVFEDVIDISTIRLKNLSNKTRTAVTRVRRGPNEVDLATVDFDPAALPEMVPVTMAAKASSYEEGEQLTLGSYGTFNEDYIWFAWGFSRLKALGERQLIGGSVYNSLLRIQPDMYDPGYVVVCKGESGSGVFVHRDGPGKGPLVLLGIFSGAVVPCNLGSWSYATDVRIYKDWILESP